MRRGYAVRPGELAADVAGQVHTAVWQEASAGLMPAGHPAGPSTESAVRKWRLRLEVDEPDSVLVVATAGGDDELIGFASGGPSRDADAPAEWELYAINVLAAHHGSGVADDLMASVVGDRAASLWVLEGNARAQAFYRRHGFTPDGAGRMHEGTGAPEIRMVRGAAADGH